MRKLIVVGLVLVSTAASAQVFRPRSKTGVVHAARKITLPGATVATTTQTSAPVTGIAPTKSPGKPVVQTAAKPVVAKKPIAKKPTKKSGGDDDEVMVIDDDDDDN